MVQRMQEDSRRIRAKEADGNELTSGQAAALLNNEKGVDKLREEVEELEEVMQARIMIAGLFAEASCVLF
jgi:peptidoglycan hydrolase CwlO-like protein